MPSLTPMLALCLTVLLGSLPTTHAQIFYNDGRNNLSNGARIGIGVAIAAGFIVLFGLITFSRRRRAQRRVMAVPAPPGGYHQHAQPGVNYAGAPGHGGVYNQGGYYGQQPPPDYTAPPQYPPPTHGNDTNYAPPPGAPPNPNENKV